MLGNILPSVTSLTNSTSHSHSPIPSSPLFAAFVNRGAIELQPTSRGGPPPSKAVSPSTSHPVQGTLAAKINVGCECLMAGRCLLRCRFCRCPCILLFRLQDTLKCRSSCSTCTAKLRLSRSTRVVEGQYTCSRVLCQSASPSVPALLSSTVSCC